MVSAGTSEKMEKIVFACHDEGRDGVSELVLPGLAQRAAAVLLHGVQRLLVEGGGAGDEEGGYEGVHVVVPTEHAHGALEIVHGVVRQELSSPLADMYHHVIDNHTPCTGATWLRGITLAPATTGRRGSIHRRRGPG